MLSNFLKASLVLVWLLTASLDTRVAHAQGMNNTGRLRRELTLTIGEQQSISAQDVRSYSVGDENIVEVRLPREGGQFIVVGRRPGNTTLLLIMQDGSQVNYRITVVTTDTPRPDVESRDSIRLDLYYVQVSDSYVHQLGIGYPGSFAATVNANLQLDALSGSFTAATFGFSNFPLPRVDLLQATGWARISRQASLVTTNGSQARFESGGEINVRVVGPMTAQLQRLRYGSELEVLPRYDRNTGRVELKISADVADLSDDRGTGVPGRTTSHLEALVNVQAGQSVVLAGLSSDSEQSNRTGLPFLSQIPILGMLFGSHGNRVERTRSVLIIVPTVVDNVAAQARNHIREALRIYDAFDGRNADEVNFITPPSTQQTPPSTTSSGASAPSSTPPPSSRPSSSTSGSSPLIVSE